MVWGTPELVGNPKFLEILEVKTQMSAKMILMSLPSIEIRWFSSFQHLYTMFQAENSTGHS
jgi:hypothetical protein